MENILPGFRSRHHLAEEEDPYRGSRAGVYGGPGVPYGRPMEYTGQAPGFEHLGGPPKADLDAKTIAQLGYEGPVAEHIKNQVLYENRYAEPSYGQSSSHHSHHGRHSPDRHDRHGRYERQESAGYGEDAERYQAAYGRGQVYQTSETVYGDGYHHTRPEYERPSEYPTTYVTPAEGYREDRYATHGGPYPEPRVGYDGRVDADMSRYRHQSEADGRYAQEGHGNQYNDYDSHGKHGKKKNSFFSSSDY